MWTGHVGIEACIPAQRGRQIARATNRTGVNRDRIGAFRPGVADRVPRSGWISFVNWISTGELFLQRAGGSGTPGSVPGWFGSGPVQFGPDFIDFLIFSVFYNFSMFLGSFYMEKSILKFT